MCCFCASDTKRVFLHLIVTSDYAKWEELFLDAAEVLAAVVEAIETGQEVELVLEGQVYRVVVRAG